MKKMLYSFWGLVTSALLVACDGQTSSVSHSENSSMAFIAAGDSLLECSEKLEATLVYSADSQKVLFCDGVNWRNLDGLDGSDGKNGIDGIDGEDGVDAIEGDAGSNPMVERCLHL